MSPQIWLPQLLYDIAEKFGLTVALRFAAAYGGKRLYIPEKLRPDHPVSRDYGPDLLAWLIARWGGTDLMIPLGPSSSYRHRIAEIQRLLRAGEDSATIIRVIGCHERTLYRHKAALREGARVDDRQQAFDFKK